MGALCPNWSFPSPLGSVPVPELWLLMAVARMLSPTKLMQHRCGNLCQIQIRRI